VKLSPLHQPQAQIPTIGVEGWPGYITELLPFKELLTSEFVCGGVRFFHNTKGLEEMTALSGVKLSMHAFFAVDWQKWASLGLAAEVGRVLYFSGKLRMRDTAFATQLTELKSVLIVEKVSTTRIGSRHRDEHPGAPESGDELEYAEWLERRANGGILSSSSASRRRFLELHRDRAKAALTARTAEAISYFAASFSTSDRELLLAYQRSLPGAEGVMGIEEVQRVGSEAEGENVC